MSAPPPWPDATCKCGHGVPAVYLLGRFRGLCDKGKEIALEESRRKQRLREEEQKNAPARSPRPEIEKDSRAAAARPKLTAVVDDLRERAEKLEGALDHRRDARTLAAAALAEFNEGLRNVSAVARTLLEAKV